MHRGGATQTFSYTPKSAGTKTVTITAVITIDGVDTTYTTTSTMKVSDINIELRMIMPNGGEILTAGSNEASYRVFYLNGEGQYFNIYQGSATSFTRIVPDTFTPSNNRIQVKSYNSNGDLLSYDRSDGTFMVQQ